jgi:transposase-like protein
MSPVLSIRDQRCPNPACPGRNGAARRAVVIHSREHRRFRCTACGKTWVERRRATTYRLRYPDAKVARALRCLAAGLSIRATAELLDVNPGTIMRWKKRRGRDEHEIRARQR